MSVSKVTKRVSAAMAVVVGTDPETGGDLTKNVQLSGLRGDPDLEKIMAVVAAAGPCLKGDVAGTTLTEVSTLEVY